MPEMTSDDTTEALQVIRQQLQANIHKTEREAVALTPQVPPAASSTAARRARAAETARSLRRAH
jgi:hypothetical protein